MQFLWTPMLIFVLALILLFGVACGKRSDLSYPTSPLVVQESKS